MMLASRTGIVATLLIALLTWLLLKGSDPTEADYRAVQRTLKTIELEESQLQGDVLRARAGLLHDYDPLNQHLATMRAAVTSLSAQGGDSLADPMRQIGQAVEAQATLVESFKTDNAVLQTSLAYFDLLSARVSAPGTDPQLAATIGALASVISRLARDSSPEVTADVSRRLDVLATMPVQDDAVGDRTSLVAHGRVLVDVLPRVDAVLRRWPTSTTEEGRTAYQTAANLRWIEGERKASRYRVVLYAVALGLLVLLLLANKRLGQVVERLRGRADIEHAIGQASGQFIGSQLEDIEARLGEALRLLGEGACADRCYLLDLEGSRRVDLWARPGYGPNPGWPSALFDAAAAIDPDHLEFWFGNKTMPPALLAVLLRSRLVDWCAVGLLDEGRPIALLGFDACTASRVLFDGSPGLLGVAANVVGNALKQQRMTEQRRDLETKLERARRLEAVGTFTSGVAHNFNNVLNVILGHAEIVSDALSPDSAHRRNVLTILQAGERAREIVSQILDFGRRGHAARHPTSLDKILRETLAHLATAAEPVAVTYEGGDGGALVLGDPTQLQQVIVNLIRNGSQASPPGAPILVALERLQVPTRRSLSHGHLAAGSHLRLRVVDQGSGMDLRTQRTIFEPFFTTKADGTGLGLATAREIVHESGGAIDVTSEVGQGSTFEVWLPVARRPEVAAAARGAAIMIVSSDRPGLLRDEEILAALGYEPIGFADAEAALQALRREPQRFAAMIVDRTLSDMSGWRLARAATDLCRLPVIVSLAVGEEGEVSRANSAAVAEVVRRPWRSSVMASIIGRHVAVAAAEAAASPRPDEPSAR